MDQALNEEQAISTGKDLYLFPSVFLSFSLAIRVPVQAVALGARRRRGENYHNILPIVGQKLLDGWHLN